jgi:hypothetical protein
VAACLEVEEATVIRVRSLVGVAAAVIATPFIGLPAWGAACVNAPVGTYTAPGFSCNVDGLLFSNLVVNVTTGNGGSVTLGNFSPFSFDNEFGLVLNYTALAPVANATADITWDYNVSAIPPLLISDAFLSLAGNTTGSGAAQVSESLSNGVILSLIAPGSTTATFTPIGSLFVLKDQVDFVGPAGGTSTTSAVTNAFSPVPGPLAGAGLPGMIAACSGLLALVRRRRQRNA